MCAVGISESPVLTPTLEFLDFLNCKKKKVLYDDNKAPFLCNKTCIIFTCFLPFDESTSFFIIFYVEKVKLGIVPRLLSCNKHFFEYFSMKFELAALVLLSNFTSTLQDAGPIKHECEHNEIIAASNTVSDLLIHRKNSGSFLKSYYLLTYACSQEGQEILRENRECLTEERIGEMTLSAGTYLSEKFLEHPNDQVCQEVNNKLQEYINAMKGICHSESAQLIMCKSLRNMFKGLHADKLHSCDFDCNIPQLTEVAEPGLASMVDHEGIVSGTAGEDGLIPETVNKNVAVADGTIPESHSLNSSSSSPSTSKHLTVCTLKQATVKICVV
ncbi:GMP synthase [Dirofilaria immitis]